MPQDKIIVFVADENYSDHVKSIAANCRIQGNYTGEFAVICPPNSQVSADFKRYGFNVLERDSKTFFRKFYVFDEYFKQWDKVLYLDCDVVVQDDLENIFKLLEIDDTKIWMDTEDSTTMLSFWRDTKQGEHKHLYDAMREKYPHVDNQTFNTCLMLFNPKYIPNGTPQKLIEIQEEFREVNNPDEWGTDQQILNLLFWHQGRKIADKLIVFWGLAEPQNDVDSEYRMYKKGDIPTAIHLSRWYSQWIKKTPDMDAYFNHKLQKPNFDIYIENLELFNSKINKT